MHVAVFAFIDTSRSREWYATCLVRPGSVIVHNEHSRTVFKPEFIEPMRISVLVFCVYM